MGSNAYAQAVARRGIKVPEKFARPGSQKSKLDWRDQHFTPTT
jgi:hypothetical protein